MPPNRIVALFTPLVAVAAGAAATWLADNVSGLEVSAGQLEAIFVVGLTSVLVPAAQWLHGAQKFERFQQELDKTALDADARATGLESELDVAGPDDSDDDNDGYDPYNDYDEPDGGYDDADEPDDGGDDDDYASARDELGQPVTVGG